MLRILWEGVFVDDQGVEHSLKVWFEGNTREEICNACLIYVFDIEKDRDWSLVQNYILDEVDSRS